MHTCAPFAVRRLLPLLALRCDGFFSSGSTVGSYFGAAIPAVARRRMRAPDSKPVAAHRRSKQASARAPTLPT